VNEHGRKIVPMVTYPVLNWKDSIKAAAMRHNEGVQQPEQALKKTCGVIWQASWPLSG